jgi:DNA modification methylase
VRNGHISNIFQRVLVSGKLMTLWTDINSLNPVASERLDYPTQKPLALLKRIIAASSDEGDLVLDPFCRCGTAIHAAQTLNRNWIGIDITHLAIALSICRRIVGKFQSAFSAPSSRWAKTAIATATPAPKSEP